MSNRTHCDYVDELENGIIHFLPNSLWYELSLKSMADAIKCNDEYYFMPQYSDVRIYHYKLFKACNRIVFGKKCNFSKLPNPFRVWSYEYSVAQWIELLKSLNIDFVNKIEFEVNKRNRLNVIEIKTKSQLFSVFLEFYCSDYIEPRALREISIYYNKAKKKSIWDKL